MLIALLSVLAALVVPIAAPPPKAPVEQVKVVAVSASSALPPWKGYTFDAANLIDGRVDTSWQPAKKDTMGVGQWVELDLGASYQLSHVEIAQGLQKVDPKLGDLYCRNNRFAAALMLFDDGTFTDVWADPADSVVKAELFYRGDNIAAAETTTTTRYIRIIIKSVQDPVDWKDIAIAELRVFGRPATAPSVDPKKIACDRPGAWPLKAAVSNFCATNIDTRSKRDCANLMYAFAVCRTRGGGSFLPFPAFDAEAFAKGEIVHQMVIDDARHRLEFSRAADGTWSVKRHTRLGADGKTAGPESEELIEPDRNDHNKCWEKLGKKRPVYDDSDHGHEGGEEGGDTE